MKRIKIVSWNIAGGRTIKSNLRFDYDRENLAYFVGKIFSVNPDIVLIQENHFKDGRSVAKEIANSLKMNNVYDYELSPSHIDKSFRIGTSILSKYKAETEMKELYPYPDFELYFKSDGRKADRHEKGLHIVNINSINIANTHIPPIGLFNYYYDRGLGAEYFKEIEKVIIPNLKKPAILAGDFSGDYNNNFNNVFKNIINTFDFKDALIGFNTRNNDSQENYKTKTDYILYSKDLKLINSGVIKTNTDHYLCYAEFEYENE